MAKALRVLCIYAVVLQCSLVHLYALDEGVKEGTDAPSDTVALGRLRSPRSFYHDVKSVGARINLMMPKTLTGLRIPIIAPIGTSYIVRVLGSERDGPVPSVEHDLMPPLSGMTRDSGVQVLHISLPAPLRITSGQCFIVLDSLSDVVRIPTTTDPYVDTCGCPTGTFTQQVLRQYSTWQTAPYTFPWQIIFDGGAREDDEPNLRFIADSVGTLEAGSKPYTRGYLIGDVNDDRLPDIIVDNTLLLGTNARSFTNVGAFQTLSTDGAWLLLQGKEVALVNVVSASTSTPFDTLIQIKNGIPSVRARQLRLTQHGKVLAAWPLPSSNTTTEASLIAALVYNKQTQRSHVVLTRIEDRTLLTIADTVLPLLGEPHTIALTSGTPSHSQITVASSSVLGIATCEVAIHAGRIDISDVLGVSTQPFNIAGPGLDHATTNVQASIWPVETKSTIETKSETISGWKYNHAPWDSERRSTIIQMDVDGDGSPEIVFPTSDTCYAVHVLRFDSEGGNYERVTASGLEILSGSADLGTADFDRDGRLDIVGTRNGHVIVLWNASPQIEPTNVSGKDVEAQQQDVCARGLFTFIYRRPQTNPYLDTERRTQMTETESLSVIAAPSEFERSCNIQVRGLQPGTKATIEVFTSAGRLIRSWRDVLGQTSTIEIPWDGFDDDGHPVASGGYSIVVTGRNTRAVANTQKVR